VWHAWREIFRAAGKKTGRTFEITEHWKEWMREAGFSGIIHTDSVKLPLGGWPRDKKWKHVGLFNNMSLEQSLEGFASYLCTEVLGWQYDDVAAIVARVQQAVKDSSRHTYNPLLVLSDRYLDVWNADIAP
jgi:hypothetical protein